jgi:hypothetical protein
MLRALTDPNKAPLRRPPRDPRDLMIAATNGWVVAYDNLSGLSGDLSDALCSLATGGGFGTRQLYTDDEEKLFDATRPVMINGIEDVATRPDLLDRSVGLTLAEIRDNKRKDERELWRQFEEVRPRVLGALLDAVSCALKNLPHTRLESKPRMADFALWVTAAEPALGWKPGTFLKAYGDNQQQANTLALEASLLTPLLSAFMRDHRSPWNGKLKDLFHDLRGRADEQTRKLPGWPKDPRALSGKLRRLAPNFRRAGLTITFHEHTRVGTPVTLDWTRKSPSPASPASPASGGKGLGGDGDGGGDSRGPSRPSPASPHNPLPCKGCDAGDGRDGVLQPDSNLGTGVESSVRGLVPEDSEVL